MKIIYDIAQGSEQWHNMRNGRVTASEFSKVYKPGGGSSTSQHRYAVQLTMECFHGAACDPENAAQRTFMGNRHTDRGLDLEPEAREAFSAMFPQYTVKECAFVVRDDGVVGCSPDGLLFDTNGNLVAGLEIKCPDLTNHGLIVDAGSMPAKYKPQVHGSMAVTGLREWYFVSYCLGFKPFVECIRADSYTKKIGAALDSFLIYYASKRESLIPKLTNS
jgi:hypothetical protein